MADQDLQISFQPRAAVLAEVRRELRAWLDEAQVPPAVVDELVVATAELCTNAVEAAEGGTVHLDARYDGSAVHLAVSNAGNAPEDLSRQDDPGGGQPHDVDSAGRVLLDRGRGLTIVRAFTDSLAIVNVDGRTVARAVRLLPT